MALPYDLDGVRAAPGMYIPKVDFDSVAAYVYGLDAATHNSILLGFREWLMPRCSGGTNLIWSALILRLAFPGVEDPSEQLRQPGNQMKAIECMFANLESFWAERTRPSGLRKIFLQFQAWLEGQEWYNSNSWDWIDMAALRELQRVHS